MAKDFLDTQTGGEGETIQAENKNTIPSEDYSSDIKPQEVAPVEEVVSEVDGTEPPPQVATVPTKEESIALEQKNNIPPIPFAVEQSNIDSVTGQVSPTESKIVDTFNGVVNPEFIQPSNLLDEEENFDIDVFQEGFNATEDEKLDIDIENNIMSEGFSAPEDDLTRMNPIPLGMNITEFKEKESELIDKYPNHDIAIDVNGNVMATPKKTEESVKADAQARNVKYNADNPFAFLQNEGLELESKDVSDVTFNKKLLGSGNTQYFHRLFTMGDKNAESMQEFGIQDDSEQADKLTEYYSDKGFLTKEGFFNVTEDNYKDFDVDVLPSLIDGLNEFNYSDKSFKNVKAYSERAKRTFEQNQVNSQKVKPQIDVQSKSAFDIYDAQLKKDINSAKNQSYRKVTPFSDKVENISVAPLVSYMDKEYRWMVQRVLKGEDVDIKGELLKQQKKLGIPVDFGLVTVNGTSLDDLSQKIFAQEQNKFYRDPKHGGDYLSYSGSSIEAKQIIREEKTKMIKAQKETVATVLPKYQKNITDWESKNKKELETKITQVTNKADEVLKAIIADKAVSNESISVLNKEYQAKLTAEKDPKLKSQIMKEYTAKLQSIPELKKAINDRNTAVTVFTNEAMSKYMAEYSKFSRDNYTNAVKEFNNSLLVKTNEIYRASSANGKFNIHNEADKVTKSKEFKKLSYFEQRKQISDAWDKEAKMLDKYLRGKEKFFPQKGEEHLHYQKWTGRRPKTAEEIRQDQNNRQKHIGREAKERFYFYATDDLLHPEDGQPTVYGLKSVAKDELVKINDILALRANKKAPMNEADFLKWNYAKDYWQEVLDHPDTDESWFYDLGTGVVGSLKVPFVSNIMGISKSTKLTDAANNYAEGKMSIADIQLVSAYSSLNKLNELKPISAAREIGAGLGETVNFMAEIMLTGGAFRAGQQLGYVATKKALEGSVKVISKFSDNVGAYVAEKMLDPNFVEKMGGVIGALSGGLTQSLVLPSTPLKVAERMTPEMIMAHSGSLDDAIAIVERNSESSLESILKGLGVSWTEMLVERLGGSIAVGGAKKALFQEMSSNQFLTRSVFGTWIRNKGFKSADELMGYISKNNVSMDGIVPEMIEEFLQMNVDSIITGDRTLAETNTGENLGKMAISVSLFGGLMNGGKWAGIKVFTKKSGNAIIETTDVEGRKMEHAIDNNLWNKFNTLLSLKDINADKVENFFEANKVSESDSTLLFNVYAKVYGEKLKADPTYQATKKEFEQEQDEVIDDSSLTSGTVTIVQYERNEKSPGVLSGDFVEYEVTPEATTKGDVVDNVFEWDVNRDEQYGTESITPANTDVVDITETTEETESTDSEQPMENVFEWVMSTDGVPSIEIINATEGVSELDSQKDEINKRREVELKNNEKVTEVTNGAVGGESQLADEINAKYDAEIDALEESTKEKTTAAKATNTTVVDDGARIVENEVVEPTATPVTEEVKSEEPTPTESKTSTESTQVAKNERFRESEAKDKISEIARKIPLKSFFHYFRKHIDPHFSQSSFVAGGRTGVAGSWDEQASSIIGDGSYNVTKEQYDAFMSDINKKYKFDKKEEAEAVDSEKTAIPTESDKKEEAKPKSVGKFQGYYRGNVSGQFEVVSINDKKTEALVKGSTGKATKVNVKKDTNGRDYFITNGNTVYLDEPVTKVKEKAETVVEQPTTDAKKESKGASRFIRKFPKATASPDAIEIAKALDVVDETKLTGNEPASSIGMTYPIVVDGVLKSKPLRAALEHLRFKKKITQEEFDILSEKAEGIIESQAKARVSGKTSELSEAEKKKKDVSDFFDSIKIDTTGMALSMPLPLVAIYNKIVDVAKALTLKGMDIVDAINQAKKQVLKDELDKGNITFSEAGKIEDLLRKETSKIPKGVKPAEKLKEYSTKMKAIIEDVQDYISAKGRDVKLAMLEEFAKNYTIGDIKKALKKYITDSVDPDLKKTQLSKLLKAIAEAEDLKTLARQFKNVGAILEEQTEEGRQSTLEKIIDIIKNPKKYTVKTVNDKERAKVSLEAMNDLKTYIDSLDVAQMENMTQDQLDSILDDIDSILEAGRIDTKAEDLEKEVAKAKEEAIAYEQIYGTTGENRTSDVIVGEEEIKDFLKYKKGVVIIDGMLIDSLAKYNRLASGSDSAKSFETKSFTSKSVRANEAVKKPIRASLSLAGIRDLRGLMTGMFKNAPKLREMAEKVLSNLHFAYVKRLDEIHNLNLRHIQERNNIFGSKRKAVSRLSTAIEEQGVSSRIKVVTPDHMVYYYNLAQVGEIGKDGIVEGRRKLINSGVNMEMVDEYMNDAKNSDLKEYADYLMDDFYPSMKANFNDIYYSITGMNLPDGKYVPQYSENMDDLGANFEEFFSTDAVTQATAMSNRMKERVNNPTAEVDVTSTSTHVLEDYIKSMAHAKYFIPVAKSLSTFINSNTSPLIMEKIGSNAFDIMKENLDIIINDRTPFFNIKGQKVNKGYNRVMDYNTFVTLAVKFSSIPKQAVAFINSYYQGFNDGIYPHDVMIQQGRFLTFATLSKNERKLLSELLGGAFMAERFKGGNIDLETRRLIKEIESSSSEKVKSILAKIMMSPIAMGDYASVFLGDAPLSLAYYNKAIKSGMSHEQAFEYAYKAFTRSVDESKQSTKSNLTTAYQRNPAFRLLNTFKTAQTQAANKTMTSLQRLFNYKNLGLSKNEILQDIHNIGGYLAGQMAFATISSALLSSIVQGDADDDDKKRFIYDIALDTLQSSIDGYGFSGLLVNAITNGFTGNEWKNNTPIIKFIHEIATGAVENASGVAFTEKEWDDLTEAEKKVIWDATPIRNIVKQIDGWKEYSEGDKNLWDAIMGHRDFKSKKAREDKLFELLFDEKYQRGKSKMKKTGDPDLDFIIDDFNNLDQNLTEDLSGF